MNEFGEIQTRNLGKLKDMTVKLEQFNLRSEVLLSKDGLLPKIQKQRDNLVDLRTRVLEINRRMEKLQKNIDKQVKYIEKNDK
eukprot:snap_masked-scaffold_13-processed-gene-0.23-mRNA-1 protein AED:1.00 eAED:1.00 QI:0/-1/0/0/-1/1/1/0/82